MRGEGLGAVSVRWRPSTRAGMTCAAGGEPLRRGRGEGAEVRQALGTAVFAGMIGVTLFGLFLTPVFYVALRKLAGGGRPASHHGSTLDGEQESGDHQGRISGDNHA